MPRSDSLDSSLETPQDRTRRDLARQVRSWSVEDLHDAMAPRRERWRTMRTVSGLGPGLKLGIHTGEVQRRGNDLRGRTIAVARAIARAAADGEVWVARVVCDLVHGSRLRFEPRGDVELEEGSAVAVFAGEDVGEMAGHPATG